MPARRRKGFLGALSLVAAAVAAVPSAPYGSSPPQPVDALVTRGPDTSPVSRSGTALSLPNVAPQQNAVTPAPHLIALRAVANGTDSLDNECSQQSPAWITRLVQTEREIGATVATINAPYDTDPRAYGWCRPADPPRYEQTWADAIHGAGLRAWFRQTWISWWGIYGEPKLTYATKPSVVYETAGGAAAVLSGADQTSYLARTYRFIVNHPSFFADGDIFSPATEPDGAGIGPSPSCRTYRCQFPNVAEFNRFLRDSLTVDRRAFEQLKLNVFVGMFGTSCYNVEFQGLPLLEPSTVSQMGVVSTDCYVADVPGLMQRLAMLHEALGVPLVISEWGDIWDLGREPATSGRLTDVVHALMTTPYILGIDYWQATGWYGEGVINRSTLQPNQVGETLKHLYAVASRCCPSTATAPR